MKKTLKNWTVNVSTKCSWDFTVKARTAAEARAKAADKFNAKKFKKSDLDLFEDTWE